MLAASDAYFEHLAKQDLILQAVAETKSLAPTQEELDDARAPMPTPTVRTVRT